jgi:U3 small nucleolar ribonucleoprotein protein LCP5
MAVAAESSAPAVLSTLTDSLVSAASSFPSDNCDFLPPPDGTSLFDVKNDLLLSYIQNLVFLIILKLRDTTETKSAVDADLDAATVQKLTELRVYLERGVRPLEGRLKYQIEKVLGAVGEVEHRASRGVAGASKNGNEIGSDEAGFDSDQDEAVPDTNVSETKPDPLSYRPNPAALLRKPDPAATESSASSGRKAASGTYKPPRITPTAMPTSSPADRREAPAARRRKSHLLDDYISSELSQAPQAQPSIGSNLTIVNRGRGALSARDRQKEKERTAYEEANFQRLPSESKAERRKARQRGEGVRRNQYGGEDFVGLGDVGDRVARSVGEKGKESVMERRAKRRRDVGDSVRGDGLGIGDAFEKRRKVADRRAAKKRRV